ncbi:MAG: hypothetical protein H0V12_07200 [Chloroflexi bacterium]|nr:hypothetical protein [Chloroflexota bacterium]
MKDINETPDEPIESPENQPEAAETAQDAPQDTEAVEVAEGANDSDLVRSLRSESRNRKEKLRSAEERIADLEAEVADHRKHRLEQTIAELASPLGGGIKRAMASPLDLLDFADASTLLDDAGRPDPDKIGEAIDGLLARKPHLAYRWGSMDGGVRTAPSVAPSLGSLIGRVARGDR